MSTSTAEDGESVGGYTPRTLMTMNTIKKQARTAGLLYFLLGITAPFGLMVMPGRLIVSGNATETAERIRASESLFRLGIASELVPQIIVIFLVMALFRLFKGVSENLAWQVVILGALVSVPIMFVNVLNEIAALILIKGPDFLSMFDPNERDALAYLFLRVHTFGIDVASIFWGLWLFPLGLLVIRSGFIPRIFGVLLIVAGAAYLVSAFTTLLLPQYAPAVGRVAMILEMGEVPIIFWLLIWGARPPRSNPPATHGPATS